MERKPLGVARALKMTKAPQAAASPGRLPRLGHPPSPEGLEVGDTTGETKGPGVKSGWAWGLRSVNCTQPATLGHLITSPTLGCRAGCSPTLLVGATLISPF